MTSVPVALNGGEEVLLEVFYDASVPKFSLVLDKIPVPALTFDASDAPTTSQMSIYEVTGSIDMTAVGFIPIGEIMQGKTSLHFQFKVS